MGELKVSEEIFKLFIGWYNDNVSKLKSEVIMVADRVNYYDEDGDLVAYINIYMETTYHVNERLYMMNDDFIEG